MPSAAAATVESIQSGAENRHFSVPLGFSANRIPDGLALLALPTRTPMYTVPSGPTAGEETISPAVDVDKVVNGRGQRNDPSVCARAVLMNSSTRQQHSVSQAWHHVGVRIRFGAIGRISIPR